MRDAYHRRAWVVHPDRTRGLPEEKRARAEREMRLVNEAYEVLGRAEVRTIYDRCLADGSNFHETLAASRPESAAERRAREESERQQVADRAAVLAGLERALEALEPGVRWAAGETDAYFDSLRVGRSPLEHMQVHFKILPVLSEADVQGIETYAAALASTPPAGLVREYHSYVLIGGSLMGARALRRRVEAFNQRFWSSVRGRGIRASIAFAEVGDAALSLPGVVGARPELGRLSLSERAQPVRILVVDDSPDSAQRTVEQLSSEAASRGWELHVAHDFRSFCERVLNLDFAVVLLEVGLRTLGGERYAAFLESSPEVQPKPRVILHSALEEEALCRLCHQVGATGYHCKGKDLDRLVCTVEGALWAHEQEEGGRSQAAAV